MNKTDRFRSPWEQLIQWNRAHTKSLTFHAYSMLFSEQYRAALDIFCFLSSLYPHNPEYMKAQGIVYMRLNETHKAHDIFSKALRLFPNDRMITLNFIRSALAIQELELAYEYAERILQTSSSPKERSFLMGIIQIIHHMRP